MNQAHISRRHLLATGAAGALSTLGLPAFADDAAWPAKIVKMVVAFPAGGPTDTAARIASPSSACIDHPTRPVSRLGRTGDCDST